MTAGSYPQLLTLFVLGVVVRGVTVRVVLVKTRSRGRNGRGKRKYRRKE